jgi:hypothetical protein
MEVEPSSLELAVSDFPAASAGQVSSLSRCNLKWPAHHGPGAPPSRPRRRDGSAVDWDVLPVVILVCSAMLKRRGWHLAAKLGAWPTAA